ncbi:MAG: hypothetical protein LBR49_00110 [Tannerella sp.]|nr:hypothetical protein [Tannerella sp.]
MKNYSQHIRISCVSVYAVFLFMLCFSAGMYASRDTVTTATAFRTACGIGGPDTVCIDGVILLTASDTVSRTVVITGLSQNDSIKGDQTNRLLYISPGTTVSIDNLTLSGGSSASGGGAIYNAGTLFITRSILSGNTATAGNGGAIINSGTLTISNSILTANTASGHGGAIYNAGAVSIVNATLTGNKSSGNGGAVYNNASLIGINSIFAGNFRDSSKEDIIGSSSTTELRYCIYETPPMPHPSNRYAQAEDIFSIVTTPYNTATAIKPDGPAATGGALAGYTGTTWVYSSDGLSWKDMDDNAAVAPADTLKSDITGLSRLGTTNYAVGARALTGSASLASLAGTVAIAGNAIYNNVLRADRSGLTSTPAGTPIDSVMYQWKRNGQAIDGATDSIYRIAPADLFAIITVTVKATNLADSVTSAATGAVAKATPTVAMFSFSPAIAIYDGLQKTVAIQTTAATGLGAVTVNYNNNPIPPFEKDTYNITVDIAEGLCYTAAGNLSLGSFIIVSPPLVPASRDFGIVNETYTEIAPQTFVIFNNAAIRQTDITITADSGTGFETSSLLSGRTYIDSGDSDSLRINPKNDLPPGIYEDTIRISSMEGWELAIGVKFSVSKIISVIKRNVVLPAVTGALISPTPGTYQVSRSDIFTFTVYPLAGYSIDSIKITTGHPSIDAGILYDTLSNNALQVKIRGVTTELTISITIGTSTGNETPGNGMEIWSSGKTLYVRTFEPTLLRLYNLMGALHKQLTLSPGETVIPLPAGIYIAVAGNGTTRKIIVR